MEERDNIDKDTSIGRSFFLLSSEPVECVHMWALFLLSSKNPATKTPRDQKEIQILESFPNMYNLATMGFG